MISGEAEEALVGDGGGFVETAEVDLFDAAGVGELAADADGDFSGGAFGVAVDASRDGWEGDGPGFVPAGEVEAVAITAGEEFWLIGVAAVPDRAYGGRSIWREG